jgi:hypothetical protein
VKIKRFIILILLLCHCSQRVENLGVFGESRNRDVLGQDGVTPIPFNDEITMWTFGDTILGSWKEAVSVYATFEERINQEEMISNSLAFTPRITTENITRLDFTFYKRNSRVVQFIDYKRGENPKFDRLWALDGIRLKDALYVFYLRIRIVKSGDPFGFALRAVGLARWNIQPEWDVGDAVAFVRLPDLFPREHPAFGAAVIERDGYLYTVGQYTNEREGSPIKVARVPVERIERAEEYAFLTRDGRWVRNVADAAPFLGDVMGECSLAYNRYLRQYVIVYCQVWTGKIIMVSFREFAELSRAVKRVIFTMPALTIKGREAWYYSGKEIFSRGSMLYAIVINPAEYQPALLKIRLTPDMIPFLSLKGEQNERAVTR